jgi:glycosyltransferase involved in cell wall biosynthesis
MVSGPAAGGIRRHLEGLAEQLPASGVECAVACPASVTLPPTVPRFPLEIGDRPRLRSDLAALTALRQAAKAWKPDLLHAHGLKAALAALTLFDAPVVVTLHNLWPGGPIGRLVRLALPRARAVICVSGAIRDSYTRAGVRLRRPVVIPHGIVPAPLPPEPPERFSALFLGRLTEEKGVRVLLEAARLLEGSGLPIQVAGDGPLRDEVEAAQDRLRYLGHVEDPAAAYAGAGVVLVPSLREGFGLTALEAMASARPVIASRVGGLPEVIQEGETGVLVAPGDASALAEAIRELAAHPDHARRLGEAGRRRAEIDFSRAKMIDALLATYQAVAPAPKS